MMHRWIRNRLASFVFNVGWTLCALAERIALEGDVTATDMREEHS